MQSAYTTAAVFSLKENYIYGLAIGAVVGATIAEGFREAKRGRPLLRDHYAMGAIGAIIGIVVVFAAHHREAGWPPNVRQLNSSAEMNAFVNSAGEETALVVFFQPWNPACKELAPGIIQLTTEGQRIAVVDCETNTALVAEYSIDAYPSTLVFQKGKVVNKVLGYQRLNDLKALFAKKQGS